MQKKRVAKELLSTFKDESIIVLADWLKVRGSLKSWTKLWCVLKPGLLLLYKSQKVKSSHWIGTIILSTCELIERPSKKDGFCFKLFHPMDQSIWASRGPEVILNIFLILKFWILSWNLMRVLHSFIKRFFIRYLSNWMNSLLKFPSKLFRESSISQSSIFDDILY